MFKYNSLNECSNEYEYKRTLKLFRNAMQLNAIFLPALCMLPGTNANDTRWAKQNELTLQYDGSIHLYSQANVEVYNSNTLLQRKMFIFLM